MLASLHEDTGLVVHPERLCEHGWCLCADGRETGFVGDASGATVYSVALFESEVQQIQAQSHAGTADAEAVLQDRVVVRAWSDVIDHRLVDWATIGMISAVIRKNKAASA